MLTRIDQIARHQTIQPRQFGNDFGHGPDHIGNIGALAHLAIHFQPDRPMIRVGHLHRRADGPARGGMIEPLARIPRPAHFTGRKLQVAPGQVDTGGIAENMLLRRIP